SVEDVVHGGEPGALLPGGDGQPEGRAGGGVDLELGDELALAGELDQLARLVGVGVDGVAVGGDQVAVGGEGQAERPVEVGRVGVDHRADPPVDLRLQGVLDGEDRVVGGRGDVERAAP